jgi:hypothetical protein
MMSAQRRLELPRWTLGAAIFAGCAWACFHALWYGGASMEWYPLDEVMDFSAAPPFNHRVLLVVLARGIRALAPGHSPRFYFLVTQLPAIGLALYALRRWAALHVGARWADLAPLVFTAMYVPTIGYYTFYDVTIVAAYSLGLYFLFLRRFLPYLAVLLIGTTNHENILLLIAVFLVLEWRQPRARLIGLVALQLLLYAAVRACLFRLLPAHAAWAGGKPGFNLDLLLHQPALVLKSAACLVPWYLVAASGLRSASADLRRATVLFPLLCGVTFLVGQINEARMFDAFIPVALVLVLCAVKQLLRDEPRQEIAHREQALDGIRAQI